jgi:hypothetical protein
MPEFIVFKVALRKFIKSCLFSPLKNDEQHVAFEIAIKTLQMFRRGGRFEGERD